MKTQPRLTAIAVKQLHPRKPIKYWEAHVVINWITGKTKCIDVHESKAILTHRHGNSGIIYKAIR